MTNNPNTQPDEAAFEHALNEGWPDALPDIEVPELSGELPPLEPPEIPPFPQETS